MAAALLFALLGLASIAAAAPVRIATCSLPPQEVSSNAATGQAISHAVAALQKMDPEVILLEGATDWESCAEFAAALGGSNYKVLVCSSIRDPRTGAPARRQVAVLSKHTSYFTWADGWRTQTNGTGGYAFAAIQINGERLGFFSVQLDAAVAEALIDKKSGSTVAQPRALQDWLQAVDSFKQWTANRLDAVIIAGAFAPSATTRSGALAEARLATAFLGAPLEHPITWSDQAGSHPVAPEYVLARVEPDPDTLPGVVLDRFPITCDLELGPGPWASLRQPVVARSGLAPGESVSPAPAASPMSLQMAPITWLWWVTAALAGTSALLALGWARGRRKRPVARPALLGQYAESGQPGPSSYTVILAPLPTASSGPEPAPPLAQPVVLLEKPGVTQTQSMPWRQRALAAEQRAERAHHAIRRGLIPHLRAWLKQKMLRQLVTDRAQLLQTQQETTRTVIAVDERLARVEAQIEQQTGEYQRRLDELTRELLAAKEENRELIRTRIAQIRIEMEATRARMLAKEE